MESLLQNKRFFCREWAFQKIGSCLENKESKRNGFIITGSPGSGKTAFLTELCYPTSRTNEKHVGSILAKYFLISSSNETKTISHFIKSISSQINKKIKNLNLPNKDEDIQSLIKKWNQILNLAAIPDRKHLLVVDALDLSDDVLNIILCLQFPKWIMPVYSISHIHGQRSTKEKIKMFSSFLNRIYFDDIRKEHISRDSQQYILRRLETDSKLKSLVTKDSAEMLNQLHIKASGCFIYLEIILDLIDKQTITLRQIKDIPGTLSGTTPLPL
jgi:hypothetical protein